MSLVSELKRPNIENYRDIERDSYSSLKMYDKNKWDYFKIYVEKELGLKAINTGCVTMWMLTPEFCKSIPKKKADAAIITLTARP